MRVVQRDRSSDSPDCSRTDLTTRVERLASIVEKQGLELRRLRRLLSHDTRAEMALLAALTSEQVAQTHFTSAEVIDFAIRAPAAVLLRETLAELEAESPRKLGKMLARMEGRIIGGHVIRRTGEEAGGIVWTVDFVGLTTPNPQTR